MAQAQPTTPLPEELVRQFNETRRAVKSVRKWAREKDKELARIAEDLKRHGIDVKVVAHNHGPKGEGDRR